MPKRKQAEVNSSNEDPSQHQDTRHKPEKPLPRGKDLQSHLVLQNTHNPIPFGAEGSMYFPTYNTSQLAMQTTQWHAPSNDSSIPHTPEHERMYVRRIYTSFLCTELANDSSGSQYIKRFRLDSEGKIFYPYWAIEKCAWNIIVRPKSHVPNPTHNIDSFHRTNHRKARLQSNPHLRLRLPPHLRRRNAKSSRNNKTLLLRRACDVHL